MTTRGRTAPAAFTIARRGAPGHIARGRGGYAAHAPHAAAGAATGPAAGAHEFTCERAAGILAVGAAGAPVLGADGLPLFATPPAPVLTLTAYPALVGLRVDLRNVARETSVVTGVTDTLLAALGGSAQTFGAAIGPGFSLPVGASGTRIITVAVASQQECLAVFGGAPA